MRDLLERLTELRARDPKLQVFGAIEHRYVARPAGELTLARFEQRHRARLPEPFRRLLLEVTDGGAGPGYGVFPLDRAADDDVAEDLSLLGQPFDHDQYFVLQPPDIDPEEDEDAYDAAMNVYWREMPGTMTLCHYGCAIRAQLGSAEQRRCASRCRRLVSRLAGREPGNARQMSREPWATTATPEADRATAGAPTRRRGPRGRPCRSPARCR